MHLQATWPARLPYCAARCLHVRFFVTATQNRNDYTRPGRQAIPSPVPELDACVVAFGSSVRAALLADFAALVVAGAALQPLGSMSPAASALSPGCRPRRTALTAPIAAVGGVGAALATAIGIVLGNRRP